jgi:hypothetical protein
MVSWLAGDSPRGNPIAEYAYKPRDVYTFGNAREISELHQFKVSCFLTITENISYNILV